MLHVSLQLLFVLLLLFLLQFPHDIDGLVTTRVTSSNHLLDMATLRYREWVREAPPTLADFYAATVQLYEERKTSLCFVTYGSGPDHHHHHHRNPVGTAELTSIELEGVVKQHGGTTTTTTTTTQPITPATDLTEAVVRSIPSPDHHQGLVVTMIPPPNIWYVTDVVTDESYRGRGVATHLMQMLEDTAHEQYDVQTLLLHVKKENHPAQCLYHKLGYRPPHTNLLRILDVDRLAANAGTEGQVLLAKNLGGLE